MTVLLIHMEGVMSELEQRLRHEFERAVSICIELGYKPMRFVQMLRQAGPVMTATTLVTDPTFHEGFTRLWEMGRLDLSVEAIIIRDPYRALFPPHVLDMARKRLAQLNYNTDS